MDPLTLVLIAISDFAQAKKPASLPQKTAVEIDFHLGETRTGTNPAGNCPTLTNVSQPPATTGEIDDKVRNLFKTALVRKYLLNSGYSPVHASFILQGYPSNRWEEIIGSPAKLSEIFNSPIFKKFNQLAMTAPSPESIETAKNDMKTLGKLLNQAVEVEKQLTALLDVARSAGKLPPL